MIGTQVREKEGGMHIMMMMDLGRMGSDKKEVQYI